MKIYPKNFTTVNQSNDDHKKINLYKEALETTKEIDNNEDIATCYYNLGCLFTCNETKKCFQQAIIHAKEKCFQQAIIHAKNAKKPHNNFIIGSCYNLLSEIYSQNFKMKNSPQNKEFTKLNETNIETEFITKQYFQIATQYFAL